LPQLVNAPGPWNWSTLDTTSPDETLAFYRAVFGWEASSAGPSATMLRLPGYADFLETLEPGLRRRHADAGAPEGFSDAIVWMAPVPAGEVSKGVGSHWNVMFAVDERTLLPNGRCGSAARSTCRPTTSEWSGSRSSATRGVRPSP
jgi:catechol 2,3-dioxygenase-like lactoylglutathione lyase family enzyme